jgi:predicted nucleotidyltransferase
MVYNKPIVEEHMKGSERSTLVRQAAQRIRRIQRHRDRQLRDRRCRAREWGFKIAADLAAADPDLKKVIGFGSSFETWRNFREDSDIDLAIIGGDWFRLIRHIPEGEFEVSLVELDQQNPEFIAHVLNHGEVLYEKQ